MKKEEKLLGITVVPGKGLGTAYFVGRGVEQPSKVSISRQDVGDQIMRFNEIREKAKKEYAGLVSQSDSSITPSILQIYEHILDDPSFIGQVVESISTKLYDLETSIRLVLNELVKRFNAAGTQYLKERSGDIVEVCEKLISYLYQDDGRAKAFHGTGRARRAENVHAVGHPFLRQNNDPGGCQRQRRKDLARGDSLPAHIRFPWCPGSRTSRSIVYPGDQLYVDADKGLVHVRPSAAVVTKVPKQKAGRKNSTNCKTNGSGRFIHGTAFTSKCWPTFRFPKMPRRRTVTAPTASALCAPNTSCPTEKVFRMRRRSFRITKKYFQSLRRKHCVVRVMDIGGDKIPEFFDMPAEYNPFMGWRAIRILLERKDLFESQLSAIMKAGKKRNYSIMLPMVTTLQEWQEAKKVIVHVAEKLNVKVPQCGVLFEVPLAILEMNTFMKEIDFASIGTNDLIQYLSAADRNNSKVNYLYNPIEPAFLRIIKNAINVSRDNGKPLSICGEMAGNAFHTILLVGLGLQRFSMMPRNIPIIKELVSRHQLCGGCRKCVSHRFF